MGKPWNLADIEDLSGKVAVVTGANSGVGFYTAEALANAGANVIMACRNLPKSQGALAQIEEQSPGRARLVQLDVSDLESVARFADQLRSELGGVDILVNNAGIMGGPRAESAQGFEAQMATNYLGHFALTARLWPLLTAPKTARVVSLSSLAARHGLLRADLTRGELVDPSPYVAFAVYSNTKQAMLLFSQELARRSMLADTGVVSVAAHPGVSSSNLFNRQLQERHLSALVPFADGLAKLTLQSAEAGALPSIRAAADSTIPNGAFVGPSSITQFRGSPRIVPLYGSGRDQPTATRLWVLSEDLTGCELLANY